MVAMVIAIKKPPTSMLYPAQRRDRVTFPIIKCSTRHWLDFFTRAKSSLSLKTHDPPERELVDKTAD